MSSPIQPAPVVAAAPSNLWTLAFREHGTHSGLNPRSALIALIAASHATYSTGADVAVTYEALGRMAGVGKQQVGRAFTQLRRLGWMTHQRRSAGAGYGGDEGVTPIHRLTVPVRCSGCGQQLVSDEALAIAATATQSLTHAPGGPASIAPEVTQAPTEAPTLALTEARTQAPGGPPNPDPDPTPNTQVVASETKPHLGGDSASGNPAIDEWKEDSTRANAELARTRLRSALARRDPTAPVDPINEDTTDRQEATT